MGKMKAMMVLVVVTLRLKSVWGQEKVAIVTAREVSPSPIDSYLDAFEVSQKQNSNIVKLHVKSDREFNEFGDYPYPGSQAGYPYGPGPGPQPPKYHYGQPPPVHNYGPPAQAPAYSPSGPAYGPPSYGPPHPPLRPFYGMPHGKILLKIVIFKKIVSLIAILCLLLFVPSLKHKNQAPPEPTEEDDELRKFASRKVIGGSSFDNMTAFVLEVIENFGKNHTEGKDKCDGVYCKVEGVVDRPDKKVYRKLAQLYSQDEEN